MRRSPVLTLLLAATAAAAAPTAAPVTYVLDYGGNHLGNDAWIAATVAAGPQVLHLGKDVPMTHNWGPIRALGGENQAYGKGDSVRRLSPAELRERIAGLKDMVARLHQGVPIVMPYICAMTIGGDPVKRSGFWEFYDHWNEYAEFGLGPRPADDPQTWLQVNPDGSPRFFYALTDGRYPPYEPNLRYAVCMNNPCWRAWSEQVVRLCAQVGYDGVFVDNGGSQHCYCHYCQEGFRKWLAARYQAAQLRRYFGADTADDLKLSDLKAVDLLAVETQRFWMDTLRRHHAALKAAGEGVHKPFYVFPNGGEQRPQHVEYAFPDVDFLMYERSTGDFGTNPGRAERRLVRDLKLYHYNDNIFEYKLSQSVGGAQRPLLLTRGGYPATLPELDLNPNAAEAGMAEAAAFGNGGGFMLRTLYEEYAPIMHRWRAFHEQRAALYTDRRPWASVGLACFGGQATYGNKLHIPRVRALTAALLDCHLLTDYVLEEQFTRERLQGYACVIVPEVAVMSTAQVQALRAYAEGGGKVLLIGGNALQDEYLQPYATAPLPAQDGAWGKGQVLVRAQLPAGARALWPLLGTLGLQQDALYPPENDFRTCFNGFASPDGRTLYLHVVNYDVPLGRDRQPVVVKDKLAVRLPVPAGRQLVSARVFDPDREQALALTPQGNALQLPPLRVYQVVEVEVR